MRLDTLILQTEANWRSD